MISGFLDPVQAGSILSVENNNWMVTEILPHHKNGQPTGQTTLRSPGTVYRTTPSGERDANGEEWVTVKQLADRAWDWPIVSSSSRMRRGAPFRF